MCKYINTGESEKVRGGKKAEKSRLVYYHHHDHDDDDVRKININIHVHCTYTYTHFFGLHSISEFITAASSGERNMQTYKHTRESVIFILIYVSPDIFIFQQQ